MAATHGDTGSQGDLQGARQHGRVRERPRAQVVRVPELGIGTERAEESLLECVLGSVPAQSPHEECVDLVPVLLVETLEGRQRHVDIL